MGTSSSGDDRFLVAGKDLLNAPTPASSTQVANYNSPYGGSSTQLSQYGPSPDYHTPSHSVPSAGSPGVFRSPAATAPNQLGYAQESPHGSYDTTHEQLVQRKERYAKSKYPLDDVQEACLLRHFVEVISPWVGHQSPHVSKPSLCYSAHSSDKRNSLITATTSAIFRQSSPYAHVTANHS